MTAQQAAHSKVEPFYGAVLGYGLHCVLRTGGCETARRGCEGRYTLLVEAYGQYEYFYNEYNAVKYTKYDLKF